MVRNDWTRILFATIVAAGIGLVLWWPMAHYKPATAQDGDLDRVTALETRVADLTEDLTSIREDFADQLLPEPRPASDFGASKFNVGSLSDDAIVLRCSTGTWAETYLDLLCDQIATP